MTFLVWHFFFFFQAEDGIRDHCVTGVQTCALPISGRRRGTVGANVAAEERAEITAALGRCGDCGDLRATVTAAGTLVRKRSEERRVGKECRSRGVTNDEQKNNSESRCSARPFRVIE